TLYVANGGNNAVAIVQPWTRDPVRGFIPVGWFPTGLALTKTNDRLLIGNGYGFGSIAPVAAGAQGRRYSDRKGEISIVPLPVGARRLSQYTAQVRQNNRTIGAGESPALVPPTSVVPVPPDRARVKSPIEHVIYIIKENRTYDQVFGDLPQGNGDPSLAIFGRTVTPNLHALVEQFVLLDN